MASAAHDRGQSVFNKATAPQGVPFFIKTTLPPVPSPYRCLRPPRRNLPILQ